MKLVSASLVIFGLIGSIVAPVMAASEPLNGVHTPASSDVIYAWLPEGPALSDGVLSNIQADGLAFAVFGMVLGGLGGLVSYTTGVAVDAYHGNGWNFNISDAQKEIYKGEAGAAFIGLLTPEP